MDELLAAFGAQDLATPAGYLDGELYSVMLPLLLSGLGIATVTALTSGDEDAGRLEFVHALPVARRGGVAWPLLRATMIALAVVGATVAAVMVGLRPVLSYAEVPWSRLVLATTGAALLAAFLHASIAFAVGGLGRRRAQAVAVSVLVAVVGYLAALVVPLVDVLRWVRLGSPWYWALQIQPTSNGAATAWWFVIVGATALLVALGTNAVERRDIRSA